MNTRILWALVLVPSAVLATAAAPGQNSSAESSRALFERRILPILRSPNPSSCSECHLSGVDLKDYIRPGEAATFARLRDSGMIDVRRPNESRLLKLIRMSNPRTPLVKTETREAEYAAFRDWIAAAAANPSLAALSPGEGRIGPAIPAAVIRHERIDRVLASFERNIWSQQGRCMGCHTPGTDGFSQNVAKYGEKVHWFLPDSPEATMRRIIDWKLVDVDQPEKSLLLLKPLNRVPHGGGVKFLYGDAGYKLFRAWIEDYAAAVKGAYRTSADLPPPAKEALVYTDCILTVQNIPKEWGQGLLRVDVYPWDAARGAYAQAPAATGDRGADGGGGTNILLFMPAPPGSEREAAVRRSPRIPQGRCLLKYYFVRAGQLDTDYRKPIDSPEFYRGSQEIASDWTTGWGAATKVVVEAR